MFTFDDESDDKRQRLLSAQAMMVNMFNDKESRISELEEDLECAHMYLDDLEVPRKDKKGNTYSLVGRIKHMDESVVFQRLLPKNDHFSDDTLSSQKFQQSISDE